MMYKSLRIISTALALLIAASATRAQDEIKYKELPRFYRINATLYRGGQPVDGGFQRLVSLGIKSVINLRDSDERERAEESEVRAAGLRYFNVPLHGLWRPTDEQVERVLAIISEPENQPVFVHCRRGAERTGTVIAIYRISHDGWTGKQAEAEAKRCGMGFWVFRMKGYIHDYYRRHSADKAKVSRWSMQPRGLAMA